MSKEVNCATVVYLDLSKRQFNQTSKHLKDTIPSDGLQMTVKILHG